MIMYIDTCAEASVTAVSLQPVEMLTSNTDVNLAHLERELACERWNEPKD